MGRGKERSLAESKTPLAEIDFTKGDFVEQIYAQEGLDHSILTRKEEIQLAKKIETGQQAMGIISQNGHLPDEERKKLRKEIEEGEEARERFIRSNLRLVASVAKKFRGRRVEFLDLVQEGNIGLMKALEKYDHQRGNRFSTYATWWIRQKIVRFIHAQSRTIRLPAHVNDQLRRYSNDSENLASKLGRIPTPEEIAVEMGETVEKVKEIERISRLEQTVSLDILRGEEEDSPLYEVIPSEVAVSEEADQALLSEGLEEAFSGLSLREKGVLKLRYGLIDGSFYTLEEIGKRFGLTRERIRQIEKQALRKLRHPLRARKLKDYLE